MRYTVGTGWAYVGGATFTPGPAGGISLAFDPVDGKLWAAFKDQYNNLNKGSVLRFDGTSWSNVGSAGFAPGVSADLPLAFSAAGTPFIAYQDTGNGNAATVMQWDTSAWNLVGQAGFSATFSTKPDIAINSAGEPVVSFSNVSSASSVSVMKYDAGGGTWSLISTSFASGAESPKLALDASTNQPYVAFSKYGANFASFVSVYKYVP